MALPSIVVRPGQLERAVDEAPAGGVLHLNAGEHHLSHPLEVDKPLSLFGEGMNNTRVVGTGEGHVVMFVGNGRFVAHDLSFAHKGTRWADVVDVVGGEIDIRRCRFTGGWREVEFFPGGQKERGGNGIVLRGATEGLVTNCESVKNHMHGIAVGKVASPLIKANVCRGNDYKGIFVYGKAQPMLEENRCEENQGGIRYLDRAAGRALHNTCSRNRSSGLTVGEQAHPTLETNICQENGLSGLSYENSGTVSIARHNICSDNKGEGISVFGPAQPVLESNTCQNNARSGIGYKLHPETGQAAAGTARHNICSGNKDHGIYVSEHAYPTLEANICTGNGKNAVYREATARPIIKKRGWDAVEGFLLDYAAEKDPYRHPTRGPVARNIEARNNLHYFVRPLKPIPELDAEEGLSLQYDPPRSDSWWEWGTSVMHVYRLKSGELVLSYVEKVFDEALISGNRRALEEKIREHNLRADRIASDLERATGLRVHNYAEPRVNKWWEVEPPSGSQRIYGWNQ
jgi:parallel beta-helix repeat protein